MKKISLFLTLFVLLTMSKPVFAQEKSDPKLTITNLTSTSFTVSWFTDKRVDQAILYGKAEPLTAWGVDDRGQGEIRDTHHITLRNLTPNTEYKFRIGTESKTFSQKTAAAIPGTTIPPLPERFYGTVVNEDNIPTQEALVYMRMNGAELLSTFVRADSSWEIRTVNTRAADLNSYYKVVGTKYVDLFARSGFEGEGILKIFAFGRVNSLNLELTEPRVPFFKIQLPDQPQYRPGEVAASSSPSSGAGSVQTPGFFSTIWARIRDIF